MPIPISEEDLHHLKLIRERLHANSSIGKASILVGAGFSRNALRSSDTPPIPLWNDLAANLGTQVQNGSKDPLTVAEEFEAEFTRGELERTVFATLKDEAYNPGKVHECLLKLPWADVFTTNYDTLLEKAAASQTERIYSIIKQPRDLGGRGHPRIVKLHGTTNEPGIILTAEDYRRYPTTHAPFVNLVQQSLMENTFLLVGFSATDPNFDAWLGWVRDHLGDHMPPLYLITFRLTRAQELRLRKRNVIPIRIGSPTVADRSILSEWLVEYLHRHSILHWKNWPSRPHDESICLYTSDLPEFPQEGGSIPVPPTPELMTGRTLNESSARGLIAHWRSVRANYPGWILPPFGAREKLWVGTEPWLWDVFSKDFRELPAPLDLELLHEITWRLQKSLVPLYVEFMPAYEHVLERYKEILDAGHGARDGSETNMYLNISLAILSDARRDGNESTFGHWYDQLTAAKHINSPIMDDLAYEQIQWSLSWPSKVSTNELVERWFPSSLNWRLRKAGLLLELGKPRASVELVYSLLNELRRFKYPVEMDPHAASLETWATTLAQLGAQRAAFEDRDWESLQTLNKNGNSPATQEAIFELESLKTRITETVRKPGTTEARGFLPDGPIVRTTVFNNRELQAPQRAAFAGVLLSEHVGIPLQLSSLPSKAVELMFWHNPSFAISLMLRGQREKEMEQLLTLRRIMGMRRYDIVKLIRSLRHRLEISLHQEGNYHEKQLEITTLTLARISIRAPRKLALKIFADFQRIRNHASDPRRILQLSPSIAEGFRILKVRLNDADRASCLVTAATDPFQTGTGKIAAQGDENIEHALFGTLRQDAYADILKASTTQVKGLLSAIGSDDQKRRSVAVLRMATLYTQGSLNEETTKLMADALWSQLDDSGLPVLQGIRRGVVLALPYPDNVDVVALFKKTILEVPFPTVDENTSAMGEALQELGLDIQDVSQNMGTPSSDSASPWQSEEIEQAFDRLEEWWHSIRGGDFGASFMGAPSEHIRLFVYRLIFALRPSFLAISETRRQRLKLLYTEMKDSSIDCLCLKPVSLLEPGEVTPLGMQIIEGFGSPQAEVCLESIRAFHVWALLSSRTGFPKGFLVPEATRTMFCGLVSNRSGNNLTSALTVCTHIIRVAPSFFSIQQYQILQRGVLYLDNLTRLDRNPARNRPQFHDETVRLHTHRLGVTLFESFQSRNESIPEGFLRLRRDGIRDPYPEIHRLWKRSPLR